MIIDYAVLSRYITETIDGDRRFIVLNTTRWPKLF